jgi:outer membrane protein TolC
MQTEQERTFMSRQAPLIGVVLTTILAALAGCHPQEPFYLKNVDNDLKYWKGEATRFDYPDVDADRLPDVSQAMRPYSLQNRDTKNTWELTLEEAMQIALKNNKVMRNISGQVQGPPDFLTRNPEVAPTIYDPALAESNPRTSAEAALSAFDAQLSTALTWERDDTPLNVNPGLAFLSPTVNADDLGTFQARLQKVTATGGTFALSHSVEYRRDRNSNATQYSLYSSDWNVKLVAEMRQPLLQGAGVQFNRIAGPGATPGAYNGVMLARINTDIALTDFEMSVRNLVSDVEVAYWELYFQYRSLDAVIAGRDSALQTWRKIYTLYCNGSKGGEAEKEAQAREQYFLFRSTAEQSLSALYATEAKLRYMLGLAATDGRLIRPKDEPTTAKVTFDWYDMLSEGLARSPELREQKWIVKRRELELIASKNFLLPKLDLVGQYRWLGMGNRLDGSDSLNLAQYAATLTAADSNAYRTLMDGQYQEWQLGVQGQINLGFRREMMGVRNADLALMKEKVKLQEDELEISHQLAFAMRDLEANYVLSQTDFNRRIAADRQVKAVAAAYETGTITLDVLLNAQQQLAQAESDYYRALVNYNKSIAQVHYRKGSLLEYNGVYLAEGPWPGKAYFDARRRSRAREASTYLDYGFTQPKVITRGPIEQHAGGQSPKDDGLFESSDESKQPGLPSLTPKKPEPVPTPSPEPTSLDAVPAEPASPEPAAEPAVAPEPPVKPASTTGDDSTTVAPTGRGTVGATERETVAPTSGDRDGASGWKAKAGQSRAARTADQLVLPAGWTVVEKGSSHESGENPSSTATDRPASGWKGIQR